MTKVAEAISERNPTIRVELYRCSACECYQWTRYSFQPRCPNNLSYLLDALQAKIWSDVAWPGEPQPQKRTSVFDPTYRAITADQFLAELAQ